MVYNLLATLGVLGLSASVLSRYRIIAFIDLGPSLTEAQGRYPGPCLDHLLAPLVADLDADHVHSSCARKEVLP